MATNVMILTADAGFGHRRAAEAVEAALHDAYGDACYTRIMNPLQDPAIPDLVKMVESSYDSVVTDDPTFYQLAYTATDAPVVAKLIQDVTTTVLNDTLTEWVAAQRPDVILATYPAFTQASTRAAQEVDHRIPVAVVVTDLINVHSLWFHEAADMTFAPTGQVYRQALDNGLAKERVRLTGLPVNPRIVKETREKKAIREALGWDPDMTTALIVGSARTRQTGGIARLLDRSGLPLQIVAASGGDPEIEADLESAKWRGTVHTYGMVKTMPEFMHASDFIVCKAGGLIVSESLAAGLPMILYEALPGQEVGNVRYVVESSAGAWSPGPIGVLATAYAWLADGGSELEKLRAAARRVGKPRAAYDIADWIMKQAGSAS